MMFADQSVEVTVDELCAGIVSTLSALLPGVFVADHVMDRGKLTTPAVVIEIEEWDPGEDVHSGQTTLDVTVTAYCLVTSFPTTEIPNPRRAVRTLGAQVSHAIRDQRFGLPVSPADLVQGSVDDYSPELEEYEVWTVAFVVGITIGDAILPDGPDEAPLTVWAGTAPDIGPGNEDEYDLIAEPPEVDP